MRKIRSILLIVLSVVMLTSLSLFVACNKEGEHGNSSSSTAGQTNYTVKFDTDGGNAIADLTVASGDSISLPTPTKSGYVFDGWYTDSAKTQAVEGNTYTVTGNITFYAKWAEGILVTLDPNGGTLSQTTVAVKIGAKISDALKNVVPTREHYEFDAWLENGSVLSSSRVAVAGQNISLVARYKVEVSIQVYEQNLEQNGYDLAETVIQYALENTSFKYSASRAGFKLVDNADAITQITVDADYSKNVLKVYYDRNTSQTTFHSNYPVEEMENETYTVEALYGASIDAVDFTCDGYLLIGFSKTIDGDVLYPVSFYKKNLYNADADDVTETKVTVETNQVLYAVWAKGYIDMFGGADSLFYFNDGSGDVYLSRGGVFFKGSYVKGDMFEFLDKDDNLLLTGKLFENNTFCYQDLARGDGYKMLFVQGVGVNPNTRLQLDSYNGATLLEDNTTVGKGYYLYDDKSGDYIAMFEDGTSFHFIDGYANYNGSTVAAFQIRSDYELELGVLQRFTVYNGDFVQYQYYQAIFNGYGQAIVNLGTQLGAYYYTFKNDIFTLMTSSGQSQGTYRIVEINGVKGYISYNSTFDREIYVRPSEDATLKMDGIGNATYKNGNTTLTGVYTTEAAALGEYIITFYAGDVTMKFLTGTETYEYEATVKDKEGNEQTVTRTGTRAIVNEKDTEYAEYYYIDDEAIWRLPLIAMNEPYRGKASIYLYDTSTKTYSLAMVGSYTYDNTTGRYTFTVEEYIETEIETSMIPVELQNIKSFVFGLDNASLSSYNVNYWYAITDSEDTTTEYEVVYESTTDNSTITVVGGGVAIYDDGRSNVYYTQIATNEKTGITTLTTASGTLLMVELNEEEKSFIKYLYSPRNIYLVNSEGMYSTNKYIALDGKGGAVLTYKEKDEEGNDVLTEYPGTYEDTEEKTFLGAPISVFTTDDGSTTLRLIVATSGSTYVAFVEDEDMATEYRSDAGILKLDGFYYLAEFTTSTGYTYQGTYYMEGENELVFGVIYNGQLLGYFYIDLTEDGFTVKGSEYGDYIVYENSMAIGLYVSLDGYGKASVFTFEEVTDDDGNVTSERKYIDENATYVIENGEVVITYLVDGVENKYIGTLGTLTSGDYTYRLFIILHKEVTFTYVDGNEWFVMTVNEIGNATLYNKMGKVETGSVTIINDYLFYYVNSAGSDACVYKYDVKTGVIEKLVYRNPFGYYTQDLQSLLFTQYGFAVFNNETRYYYERIDNIVWIYHYDAENPDANEYGFVKEEFGAFTDVKEWEGETYYKNDGYPIAFARKAETSDKYPLPAGYVSDNKETIEKIMFAPNGADTFAVAGQVTIAGKTYQCTVVRELNDEEEYVLYFVVGRLRYYISIDYTGVREDGTSDNYYEITACTEEIYAYSATYLQMYLFGMMFGIQIPNSWGYFNSVTAYNEEGDPVNNMLTGEFYSSSKLYDTNEELPTFEEHDFEWINSSILSVEYEGTDGDLYKLYLYIQANSTFGVYEYALLAFNRVQTIDAGDYTVEVERLLYSEANYAEGQVFTLRLYDSENNEIKLDEMYLKDGVVYAMQREYDEDSGKIISSKLYVVTLTDGEDEDVVGVAEEDETDTPLEGEEDKEEEKLQPSQAVKPYESAEVTVETLKVYYDGSDGSKGYGWVEMSETYGIVTFVYNEYTDYYFMPDVTYDEDTDTYTFVDPDGVIFTLKIVDGVAVFDYTLQGI